MYSFHAVPKPVADTKQTSSSLPEAVEVQATIEPNSESSQLQEDEERQQLIHGEQEEQ